MNNVIQVPQDAQDRLWEASVKNYEFHKDTPDRDGWWMGKCPYLELHGKTGEWAGNHHLGQKEEDFCWFSENRSEWQRPDVADIDIKSGTTFGKHDLDKGVKRILWVRPLYPGYDYFECGYDTCGVKTHKRGNGRVSILGWNYVTDPYKGKKTFTPLNMRPLHTLELPKGVLV